MGMSSAGFAVNELVGIVRRCNPGFGAIRAISWQVTEPTESSWQRWLDETFAPVLLPHLRLVIDLSATQSTKEIISLDLKLDRNLDSWPRIRSLDAGTLFLKQENLQTERLMAKLRWAVDCGFASGHFATLYAVRCNTYSIPVRTALLSYVLQEFIAGASLKIQPFKYLEASVEPINELLGASGGLKGEMRSHG